MPAYVGIRNDAFSSRLSTAAESRELTARADYTGDPGNSVVRRPFHGVQLHAEETYSTITVSGPSSARSLLLDTSSTLTDSMTSSTTSNLIIQSVQERREEKQQIVQTFGEDFVYFFGERPRMVSFQAILPESSDYQFAQEFWRNYEKVLRGTRSVLRSIRTYLSVDRTIYEGYIVSATTSRQADTPHIVNLEFTMYVTKSGYIDKLRNQRVDAEGQTSYLRTNAGDYLYYRQEDDLREVSLTAFGSNQSTPLRAATDLINAQEASLNVEGSLTADILAPVNKLPTAPATPKPSGLQSFFSGVGAAVNLALTVAGTGALILGVTRSLLDEIEEGGGLLGLTQTALLNVVDPLGVNSDLVKRAVNDATAIPRDVTAVTGTDFLGTSNPRIRRVLAPPSTSTDTVPTESTPQTPSQSIDDLVLEI